MEPGFPLIDHISEYAAHQGGLVLWYGLERPVITSKNRELVRFRIVWMAICIRDNHVMKRARAPSPQDVITTLGIIKLSNSSYLSALNSYPQTGLYR